MWRWLLLPWLLPTALPIWLLFVLPLWHRDLIRLQRRMEGRPVWLFYVHFPSNPPGDWWMRRWGKHPEQQTKGGWETNGLALPMCIIVSVTPPGDDLLQHELRHTDQWLWGGPLFPIIGGITYLRTGYFQHPFEKDARAYAERTPNAGGED